MYIPLLKYDRHFIYHDQTDGIGITALYTQADFVIITVRKTSGTLTESLDTLGAIQQISIESQSKQQRKQP